MSGFSLDSLFAPKTTQEQRDEMARSYGEQGSKDVMKSNLEQKGKMLLIVFIISMVLLVIVPPVGAFGLLALIFLSIYVVSNDSVMAKRNGRDTDTLYRVNFLEPALNKIFPEGSSFNRALRLDDDGVLSALPAMNDTKFEDFMKGRDLFSFTYKGIPMKTSHNCCTVYCGKNKDDDEIWKTVFDGQIYEANYKTRISGYVRIIPTTQFLGKERIGYYMGLQKGEVKVETDNISFNEHFNVYATSEQDAFFVLNPIVINFFTDYMNAGGKQGMFVGDDSIVITRENVSYNVFEKPMSLESIDALSVENKCLEFKDIADSCFEMLQAINGKVAMNQKSVN